MPFSKRFEKDIKCSKTLRNPIKLKDAKTKLKEKQEAPNFTSGYISADMNWLPTKDKSKIVCAC